MKRKRNQSHSTPNNQNGQNGQCIFDKNAFNEIGVRQKELLGHYCSANEQQETYNRQSLRINGWTFIAVVVYAGLTGLMTWQTKRATDAANKSVDIAHDAMFYSERAYVGVEPSYLADFAINNAATVNFVVTNHGQTPAFNARIFSRLEVLEYPWPNSQPFPFYPSKDVVFGSTATIYKDTPLPTGVKMSTSLSAQDIRDIVDGSKRRLYAGGIIYYTDIFGKPHCSRYFASIGGPELQLSIIQKTKGENPAVPWRQSNQYNDDIDDCSPPN